MYSDLKDSSLVLLGVGLAVVALLVVRGKFRCSMDMGQRNIFATNYSFFTTLYTFFLGFAVISLWQNYNAADAAITNEADSLVVQYRLAESFPGAVAFRKSLVRYVDCIKTTGWEQMENDESSDGAEILFDDIWKKLEDMKPPKGEDQSMYTLMITQMINLSKLRHQRLLLVNGNLYPPIWFIIYIGVAFTIFGFYFIESGHAPADIYFMLMMLTMILGNIFLLYELDTPFSGIISLDKTKFDAAAQAMQILGGR